MEWASAPRLNPFVPLQVCHTDTMSGLYYTTTVHGPSWKQSALVYLYTALKSVNLLQDQNPRFSPSTAFFFWRLWKLLEWLRRPDKRLLVVAAFCVRERCCNSRNQPKFPVVWDQNLHSGDWSWQQKLHSRKCCKFVCSAKRPLSYKFCLVCFSTNTKTNISVDH